jgi:flagellar assembly protein FliH
MTGRVVRNASLSSERRVLGDPAVVPGEVAPSVGAQSSGLPAPTAPGTVAAANPAAHDASLGYDEGLRRGLAEADARIEKELESRWNSYKQQFEQAERRRSEEHGQRVGALDATLQTIQKALPERFMALERQAVELAYEALCRVCGPQSEQASGSDRAGLLVDLVRQGIAQLRGHALIGLRLGTADHAAFVNSEASKVLLDRYPELRVSLDPSLEPLGCMVESDHGQLDVGLSTQLSRLRELWAQAATGSVDQEERR